MNFHYIIVDKFSSVPPEHKKAVKRWLFFQFFMLALCVTNIIFFICNWGDLRLQINDTTNILLTIIGFLFAFAGINIYSIFNTNIETEKAKMIELQQAYSLYIETTIHKMAFYDSVHQLQLYSQLIFNSPKANSQIILWIDKVREQCQCIKEYMAESKKQEKAEIYEQNEANLLALYRGLKYQQSNFLDRNAKSHSDFFKELDFNNRKEFVNSINSMFSPLDFLDIQNLDEDLDGAGQKSTWLNYFLKKVKGLCSKMFHV